MAGDAYGRLAWLQDYVMEPMIAPLRGIGLKMVPPRAGMRVLDVGCGTGAQLERYAAAGCVVAGIDLSEAMLTRARTRLGSTADLRVGDAVRLPFDDSVFDLATATLVLHEVPAGARDVVVREMQRVVRDDGRLLVTDFHPGPWHFPRGWVYRGVSLVAETVARHRDRSHEFLATDGVPGLADRLGVTIERTKVVAGGNMGLYLLTP